MDSASGPAALGALLRSAAALPRTASTDALGTQAFLQADARALQSPELRGGLAAWAASVRHPGDPDARAEDAALWEALLADPLGQGLLTRAPTPEQRLRDVAFLLAQPEPRLEPLRTYAGDLTCYAAHEMLLALQALDPSALAPIVGVPAGVRHLLPEHAEAPNAEALAALLPEALAPSRVADVLAQLADDLERRLTASPPPTPPVTPELAALLTEFPAAREALGPLVTTAATGLRALASGIRAEPEDTQRAAQSLVLGGLQHAQLAQGLVALAASLRPGHGGEEPQAPHAAERTRRELVASGATLIGTALASDVGAAVAGLLARAAEARWERLLAAGRLPLGEPALRAPGLSRVSLATGPLGAAVAELLRLYTSQLGDLGEDAFELLGEELVARLTSGEQRGLDAAWAGLLENLERMAPLQDASPYARAQVLRVLLVGATLGLLSWETAAPLLHARGPVFLGRPLAVDASRGPLPDVYRASAALAVTALADAFLLEDLHAGLLTPDAAVAQVRARGESLLVQEGAPVEPGLASALLAAMVAR